MVGVVDVVVVVVGIVVVVVVLRENVGLFLARDVKSKDGRFWKEFFVEMKLLTEYPRKNAATAIEPKTTATHPTLRSQVCEVVASPKYFHP